MGYFYYTENLNWAAKKLRLGRGLDIAVLHLWLPEYTPCTLPKFAYLSRPTNFFVNIHLKNVYFSLIVTWRDVHELHGLHALCGIRKVCNNAKRQRWETFPSINLRTGVSAQVFPWATVVRTMPNTPMLVGAGVLLYCRDNISDDDVKIVQLLFSSCAECVEISERLIDAAQAICGCGPGYVSFGSWACWRTGQFFLFSFR